MSQSIQDEQDVKTILRYLKLHDPANATKEYAVQKLGEIKQLAKQMVKDPELTKDTLRKLDEDKHKFQGWEREFIKSIVEDELRKSDRQD